MDDLKISKVEDFIFTIGLLGVMMIFWAIAFAIIWRAIY